MKRVTTLASVALFLLASSIARAQSPAPAPPDGFPPIGRAPTVIVLSPGNAPRRPLRYIVPDGTRTHMTMEMTMGMAMSMAGQSIPVMEARTVRAGADLAITHVTPGGDMTYTISYTGLSLPDAADQANGLEAYNANLRSITGTATVSNRGMQDAMEIDTSRLSNPQLKQLMDSLKASTNLSPPLPEEPVGVGAHWRIRQTTSVSNVTVFQTIECELAALDDASATIVTRTTQTGPPQPMDSPALPPGAQVMLESIAGTGTGAMAITFAGLVPIAEAAAKITMVMNITIAGQNEHVTLDTTMGMHISPGTP